MFISFYFFFPLFHFSRVIFPEEFLARFSSLCFCFARMVIFDDASARFSSPRFLLVHFPSRLALFSSLLLRSDGRAMHGRAMHDASRCILTLEYISPDLRIWHFTISLYTILRFYLIQYFVFLDDPGNTVQDYVKKVNKLFDFQVRKTSL